MSTDWPAGYGKRVLDVVDSTLSEAARIAPTLTGPEWILALHQTAARGRRGRAWANPAGNFSATLVLQLNEEPANAALRSFVAALALYDTCVAVTGRSEGFALKWPNDVLLNGGKLAGILLESTAQTRGTTDLTIGIGVNLVAAPARHEVETRALPPVSLSNETGALVEPEVFLTHLAVAYARYETQLKTYGFEPIRKLWLTRAARLGQEITARTGNSDTTGTFETVDPMGNLVLNTDRGRICIAAADIFF